MPLIPNRSYLAIQIVCIAVGGIGVANADMPPVAKSPPEELTKADIPQDLPAEVRTLIENTFSDSSIERGRAAKALGELHDRATPAISFLIRLVDDEGVAAPRFPCFPIDNKVAQEAKYALFLIGTPAVEPCLAQLKKYETTYRARLYMEVLGNIKDPRAVEPLLRLLDSRDPIIQENAIFATRDWGNPSFTPILFAALKSDKPDVRRAAALALGSHRESRVVTLLIGVLMNDKDKEVREYGIEGLEQQRDPRVVPALLAVFQDGLQDDGVRISAAWALGKRGDPHALDALLAALKDKSTPLGVRRASASGLGNAKDRRFVQPLEALAKDGTDVSYVRGDIIDAIARIAGRESIPFLTELVASADEEVHARSYAAMSIVDLTDGAVDDVRIVTAIDSGYTPPQPGDDCPRDEAVKKIARNGKTEAVRAAGKTCLKKWGFDAN